MAVLKGGTYAKKGKEMCIRDRCDILKISDNEIQWLTGKEDYTDGVRWIRERYPVPLILVSMGKEGRDVYKRQVIGRDGLWNIRINVNQYIAFVPDQKCCRLERTHIIVAGYATDMFGCALNGNDRDLLSLIHL